MALKSVIQTALKLNCKSKNFSLLNVHEGNARAFIGYYGASKKRLLHTCFPLLKKQEVTVVIERQGQQITLKGKEGDSILEVVNDNNVDIPGYGACEGTLSCSTCHVKLSQEDFEKIPLGASDEELDMLDLAPDVCKTSRLGCQICLSKELEGIKVEVPTEVKDMREIPRATM